MPPQNGALQLKPALLPELTEGGEGEGQRVKGRRKEGAVARR
jgi:hypothetical protein